MVPDAGDRTLHPPRPTYFSPRVEEYTREGMEEDQERVKVVRAKNVRCGTLTGEGTTTRRFDETLADMPAGNAYNVMQALADHFNCEVTPK